MLQVCKSRCNQCLYSANKIVSDERKEELLAAIRSEQSYFVCHKSSINGGDTCCRGFYDEDGHYSQLIRVASRIGAIEFVEEGENNP